MLSVSKCIDAVTSVCFTSIQFNQNSFNRSTKFKGRKKPLVILLPWFHSSEKALAKYSQIYKSLGCEVIEKKSRMIDFLRPNLGLKRSKEFLYEIKDILNKENYPIVIHSASIGCYFYALMLDNIRAQPELFSDVLSNIKAQVLDSPVVGTLHEMAVGVATMTVSTKFSQRILKNAVLSYFAVTKPFTISLYKKSIEVIKFHPPKLKSLLMTSENDPMALPHAFQSFVNAWLDQRLDVTTKIWTESAHARHLKFHEANYTYLIYQLLSKSLKEC